jgi:hypothetical protein
MELLKSRETGLLEKTYLKPKLQEGRIRFRGNPPFVIL